jgi:hypothetical protein
MIANEGRPGLRWGAAAALLVTALVLSTGTYGTYDAHAVAVVVRWHPRTTNTNNTTRVKAKHGDIDELAAKDTAGGERGTSPTSLPRPSPATSLRPSPAPSPRPSSSLTAGSGSGGVSTLLDFLETTDAHLADRFWPQALTANYTPFWRREPRTNGSYVLRDADFAFAFEQRDMCAFFRAFHAADEGATITVVVIGGSMTQGNDCNKKVAGANRNCAWPAHVRNWLSYVRPAWKLRLVNLGRGGCGSPCWSNSLYRVGYGDVNSQMDELRAADIVIIDTSVNDGFSTPNSLEHARAVMESDALLWGILRARRPSPAILTLETLPYKIQTNEQPGAQPAGVVSHFYNVSWVSYRQLMKNKNGPAVVYGQQHSNDADPNVLWLCNTDSITHPGEMAHELVADTVKYAFSRMLTAHYSRSTDTRYASSTALCKIDSVSAPLTGLENVDRQPCGRGMQLQQVISVFCSTPGNVRYPFCTTPPNYAALVSTSGSWNLSSSLRPPGWHGQHNGTLTIPVKFGAAPRLNLEYLRSYTGFGNVSLLMPGCKPFLIRARWDHHISIPSMMSFRSSSSAVLSASSSPMACEEVSLRSASYARRRRLEAPAYLLSCVAPCMDALALRSVNITLSFLPGEDTKFAFIGAEVC